MRSPRTPRNRAAVEETVAGAFADEGRDPALPPLGALNRAVRERLDATRQTAEQIKVARAK